MGTRGLSLFLIGGIVLVGTSASHAASSDTTLLVPIATKKEFRGQFRSHCAEVQQEGLHYYSQLNLHFVPAQNGVARYMSEEVLYSDPRCEISVIRTSTIGRWKTRAGTVLTLRPKTIHVMPLDPRLADAMDLKRSCGKRWQNGEANEVAKTPCGKEKIAQYFMSKTSQRGFDLYDCEGKSKVDDTCFRYGMNPVISDKPQAPVAKEAPLSLTNPQEQAQVTVPPTAPSKEP